MRPLLIATKNPGKALEISQILQGFQVLTLADFPEVPDVQETGATFAENALLKANYYASATGHITLADDSGLVVDALNGAPGVLSSRFAPTDRERIAKLLDLMRNVPDGGRSARFVCSVAIIEPGGITLSADGNVEGAIGWSPQGDNGFGYDPVFVVAGEDGKTMAQLPSDTKNAISHRGRALTKVLPLVRVLLQD